MESKYYKKDAEDCPMPDAIRRGPKAKYRFVEMAIGDRIRFTGTTQELDRASSAAYGTGNKKGMKFSTLRETVFESKDESAPAAVQVLWVWRRS